MDPERLRVPLNGAEVLLRICPGDSLGRSVRSLGLQNEPLSEPVSGLVVKRVHLEVIGPEELLKLS